MAATIPTVSWNDLLQSREYECLPLLNLLPESASGVHQLSELLRRRHGQRQQDNENASTEHDTPHRIIVNIPLEDLRERSFELPPRNVEFIIVVEDDAAARARQEALDFLVPPSNKLQQQKPWNVIGVVAISTSDELLGEGKANGFVQATIQNSVGEASLDAEQAADSPPSSSFRALDRLWQPDPMVEKVLLPKLLDKLSAVSDDTATETRPLCYEIWDLGAGSGRDVCFLAEQLKAQLPGTCHQRFKVVAMDQRYRSPQAISVLEQFWKRRGVTSETCCRKMELGNISQWIEAVADCERAGGVVLCMYAVRYWNKTLVQQLVMNGLHDNVDCHVNGSPTPFVFATSHFCKPHDGAIWNFDHPRSQSVLKRHELSDMFQAPCHGKWNILQDEIVSDTDHGRTLVQFVVERAR